MQISLNKQPPGTVGLDVDGDFIAAAVANDGSLGQMVSVPLEPGVSTEGEIRDPGALTRTLKELFQDNALPRRVRLGVANQQIVVRQLEMPVVANATDREAAIRFQAAEAIAMPLDEAILDHRSLGVVAGSDGVRHERMLIVAARESMVSRLVGAVKSAGLKPEGLDLNAFALVRMLGGPDVPDADAVAAQTAQVICHFGGLTNLAIASGSACLFTRPLQTAWRGDEASIGSLVEEIRLSVDFYMGQPEAQPVDRIVLSGSSAQDDYLVSELSTRSGLPVAVAEPLGGIPVDPVAMHGDPYRFTVAAGLALGDAA